MSTKSLTELLELKTKADNAYYSTAAKESVMSDHDYDLLVREIQAHPDYKGEAEVVGHTVVAAEQPVVHNQLKAHMPKMYSLDNALDLDELNEWLDRHEPDTEYCVEYKLDGLAVELNHASDGSVVGSYRGDGIWGELLRALPSIPKFTVASLRGEMIMCMSKLVIANERRIASGKDAYKNCRSAAAGTLASGENCELLTFVPYECYGLPTHVELTTQHDKMEYVYSSSDFSISANSTLVVGSEAVIDLIAEIQQSRKTLDFEIDGVVIKLNSFEEQTKLGHTERAPKWAIAYKFPPETGKSTLLDVVFQTGSYGRITPVAKIAPVELGGVTITSVTLHNFDELERLGIQLHDEIEIIRSCDVIPVLVSAKRSFDSTPIVWPERCASCSSVLARTETIKNNTRSVTLTCNAPDCRAQIVGKLIKAFGRKGFDCKQTGEALLTQLYTEGLISTVLDVVVIDTEKLMELPSIRSKKASRIAKGIECGKYTYPRFLYSLCIPELGEHASKTIAEATGNLDTLLNEYVGNWSKPVADVGVVLRKNIDNYFEQNEEYAKLLYVAIGSPETASVIQSRGSICITGKFDHYKRKELETRASSLGYDTAKSVTTKVSVLIVGRDAGSKLAAAKARATTDSPVRIISEQEIESFFKELESE